MFLVPLPPPPSTSSPPSSSRQQCCDSTDACCHVGRHQPRAMRRAPRLVRPVPRLAEIVGRPLKTCSPGFLYPVAGQVVPPDPWPLLNSFRGRSPLRWRWRTCHRDAFPKPGEQHLPPLWERPVVQTNEAPGIPGGVRTRRPGIHPGRVALQPMLRRGRCPGHTGPTDRPTCHFPIAQVPCNGECP